METNVSLNEQTKAPENQEVLEHENVKISMRFGFLGIGMGGTSIASECADITTNTKNARFPYSALLINSNSVDLAKIENKNPNTKKLPTGDGKGARRDITLGESIYKADAEKITEAIKKQFENVDFVWLVVGLGGGTGTGAVIQAIGTLMKNGFAKRFGLILTRPRLAEGKTVISNSLERLMQINKAMEGLGPILLVDNQKLFKEYSEKYPDSTVEKYLKYSNKFVAEALHDLNTVTASYIPIGEHHFDSSEWERVLKTPGLLHLARFSTKAAAIDVSQTLSHAGLLKDQIDSGVLSEGYDLTRAKRLALSILTNEANAKRIFTFDFVTDMEKMINELSPIAKEKPVALYQFPNKQSNNKQNNSGNVYFYAVFAGLEFPEDSISELIEENKRLIEQEKQLIRPTRDLFADFESSKNVNEQEEKSFEELFGENSSDKAENSDDFKDVLKGLGID